MALAALPPAGDSACDSIDVPPSAHVAGYTIGPHQSKLTEPVGALAPPARLAVKVIASPTRMLSPSAIAPREGATVREVWDVKLMRASARTVEPPTVVSLILQTGSSQLGC